MNVIAKTLGKKSAAKNYVSVALTMSEKIQHMQSLK